MFEVRVSTGAEGFKLNAPGDTAPAAFAAAWAELSRNAESAPLLARVSDVRIKLLTGSSIKRMTPRAPKGAAPVTAKRK